MVWEKVVLLMPLLMVPTISLPEVRNPPANPMIERLAPKTAAFETPSVDGDAMTLPRQVCIMRPATASPAPATTAAMTRGRRIFWIIILLAYVLLPAIASKQSFTDILDEPTNQHTKNISTVTRSSAEMIIAFLKRIFFCASSVGEIAFSMPISYQFARVFASFF